MKRREVSLIIATAMLALELTGCASIATNESMTAEAATEATSEIATACEEAYAYEEDVACEDTNMCAQSSTVADSASSRNYLGSQATCKSSVNSFDNATEESCEYEDATEGSNSYIEDIYNYSRKNMPLNSEEYSRYEEQGYQSVLSNPLSTFAADVDTASYANMRRMITEGYSVYDLPENSVRVEELVNYFSYDYKDPNGSDPFGVTTVIGDCPWNKDAKLLSMGFKTEDIDFSDTPASNLVFLIDVSGSMFSEDKLPLLQESFCMLTDNLSDKDRVSIVTYAGSDEIVLNGARGDQGRKIKNAINNLDAGGSTNGSAGINTAYELAEKHFIKGGNNRIILATDGDLNVGVTSEQDLEELISEKKESGVFLSVIGFGTGNIKDNKMEALADNGNGNYSYIDSIKEAEKVLVDELSANMLTVCKDVKFQVEFNPAIIAAYRQVGYANRVMADRDFADDTKDGGEIGAGHQVTVLYEIVLCDDISLPSDIDVENLRYADQFKKATKETGSNLDKDTELLTLSVRYKKPSEDVSNLLTYPVTFENYDQDPSDDYIFQTAVAEYGLIVSNSEYMGSADIDEVSEMLASIRLNDEYKREFEDLVNMSI